LFKSTINKTEKEKGNAMMKMIAAKRRFLILAGGFAIFWIFIIFINLNSIDDQVESIKNDEVVAKKSNIEKFKYNGAEMDLDAKIVLPEIKNNFNDDKAFEDVEQMNSIEAVNKSFPVNPKLAEIVKDEIKWGTKDVPEVNLTELSVLNGPEDEVYYNGIHYAN
jgi:hypothetical protein